MQWIYQEEKVEHLEKYLTWFTPLVSSMAAIIFAAEEQIDKKGARGRNFFSECSMPVTTIRSFANSTLWILKKIRMDWIENYQLVSSCQAASCPPWKEVKISTQKQIYNIWQDHYWEFFWLKQNAERHIRVHSQIEFTLRRVTEAELLWFGELRQVYKPENNPIRLFWVWKGFSSRFFVFFYFAKKQALI